MLNINIEGSLPAWLAANEQQRSQFAIFNMLYLFVCLEGGREGNITNPGKLFLHEGEYRGILWYSKSHSMACIAKYHLISRKN